MLTHNLSSTHTAAAPSVWFDNSVAHFLLLRVAVFLYFFEIDWIHLQKDPLEARKEPAFLQSKPEFVETRFLLKKSYFQKIILDNEASKIQILSRFW